MEATKVNRRLSGPSPDGIAQISLFGTGSGSTRSNRANSQRRLITSLITMNSVSVKIMIMLIRISGPSLRFACRLQLVITLLLGPLGQRYNIT